VCNTMTTLGTVGTARSRTESMLRAALTVIRRDGDAASIDAIAAELGVTRPIIYRHFGSRDGLADAVARMAGQELREALAEAMQGRRSPRTTVRAAIDAYLAFIERDPQLYRYLVRGPLGRGGDGSARVARFVQVLGDEVAALIRAGRPSAPAEVWSFALLGMIGVAADWWLEQEAVTREEMTDHLTEIVWWGMVGPRG
jgi:AcrR family transcriptional regulator